MRKPRKFKLFEFKEPIHSGAYIDKEHIGINTRSFASHTQFTVERQKLLVKWLQRNIKWLEEQE